MLVNVGSRCESWKVLGSSQLALRCSRLQIILELKYEQSGFHKQVTTCDRWLVKLLYEISVEGTRQ
jgi:hypothetical protein